MDAGSDFSLLADEKFDFDISLSPTSAKEDNGECEDEVFVGPVRHKEKCISSAIQFQESEKKTPPSNEAVSWSPLSGDKFVEIFKEAHLLALQLECFASDAKQEEPPQPVSNPVVEKFVEESKTKLKLFDVFNEVSKTPVAIKRETYCIQNSPFQQLPPSVQQQIGESKTDAQSADCQKLCPNLSSPLKVPKVVKTLTMSPLARKAKAPQVKSTVPPSNTGKTAGRMQSLKAPLAQAKHNLTVEKPKATKKLSPVRRRNLNSMGSTEDLLSANSSIASDVSDSSLNSSLGQMKKNPNPPSKITLNKMQFKTPSTGAGYRRNTSSSSSSRSSINTSLNSSLSSPPPASSKLNAMLNTSVSASMNNSRLKSNTGRLALVRPLGGLGFSLKTTTTDSSKSHLKPVAAPNAKANSSKSSSVSQPESPAGKVQRQTSAPNLRRLPLPPAKPESAVKAPTTKPQARVMPTPISRLKPPQKAEGMSPDRTTGKTLKPMRLLSCGDIGSGISQSTPIHATKVKSIISSLPGRCIPATPSSKLTSALPTPVSRRTSGMLTPRTMPRSVPSLRPTPAPQASSKSSIKLPAGSAEGEQKKPKATKSPFSPTEESTSTAEICCSLNFSPESKTTPVAQSEKGPVAQLQNIEVLLIDIGVDKADTKVRKQSEKESQPLIDLSNTPEVSKQPMPLKPTNIAQLIDLSSPLIKLSPAANKENVEFDSPLLKF